MKIARVPRDWLLVYLLVAGCAAVVLGLILVAVGAL